MIHAHDNGYGTGLSGMTENARTENVSNGVWITQIRKMEVEKASNMRPWKTQDLAYGKQKYEFAKSENASVENTSTNLGVENTSTKTWNACLTLN